MKCVHLICRFVLYSGKYSIYFLMMFLTGSEYCTSYMPICCIADLFLATEFLIFSLCPGLVHCSHLCLNLCSVPVLIILSI
jgi:hypothetical protein